MHDYDQTGLDEQALELLNHSISSLIQMMLERERDEFAMDVQFEDAKLSVRINIIEGPIN